MLVIDTTKLENFLNFEELMTYSLLCPGVKHHAINGHIDFQLPIMSFVSLEL